MTTNTRTRIFVWGLDNGRVRVWGLDVGNGNSIETKERVINNGNNMLCTEMC